MNDLVASNISPDFGEETLARTDHGNAIRRECILLLFKNGTVAILAATIISVIVFFTFFNHADLKLASAWLALLTTINIYRLYCVRRFLDKFKHHDQAEKAISFWKKRFFGATVLSGLLWAAAAFIFFIPEEPYLVFFLVAIYLGVGFGAMTSNSSHLPSVLVFTVPTMILFAIVLFQAGGTLYIALGLCSLLFLVVTSVVALNFNRNIVESLELRHQNLDLIERLKKAMDVATNASNAKSQFLSSMSHELRTPLNAIMGYAQLLNLDLEGEQKDSVHEILHASEFLLELIEDVLDLSKIESGQIDVELEDVEIQPLVKEVISMSANTANLKGVQLAEFISRPDHLVVRADARKLKQVLTNLLSNAIKYNTKNGRVQVSAEPFEKNRIIIRVEDSGQGIPQEKMKFLFTPFNRLGYETSAIPGTGIGLTICKRLIEAMGGRIQAESKAGKGSVFSVILDRVNRPEIS